VKSHASAAVLAAASRPPGTTITAGGGLSSVPDRSALFAGLFILAFTNGIVVRISQAFGEDPVSAVLTTCGISVIVWAGSWMTLAALLQAPSHQLRGADLIIGAGVVMLTLAPLPSFSWLALTGLGFYILWSSTQATPYRQAGAVMLALTVPMFWSRVLFALFSDPILSADAVLASLITGTERVGNTLRFADDWGYLFIAPPCSSLANVSLTVLCWVLCGQVASETWRLSKLGWGLAACTAVIAINVTRIGLIGLNHDHYDLLHGTVGAAVTNWLTFVAIVGINLYGFRRGIVRGR
jgi:hypothetical protein